MSRSDAGSILPPPNQGARMWEIKPEKSDDLQPVAKRSSLWKWIVLVVVVLVGAGLGLWRWKSRTGSLFEAQPLGALDSGTADAGADNVSAERIADGDAVLREQGSTLS